MSSFIGNRIISFSLWGDSDLYSYGAIENARIAKDIYPGWICRFYCSSEIKDPVINELLDHGSEIVRVNTSRGLWDGLFWRFLPAGDDSIDRFISRDTDSRLNIREKVAIDDWINSDYKYHVMRDHKNHDIPMLGGMWGCVGGSLNINELLLKWNDFNNKGCDQKFLSKLVWPQIKDECLGHASYYHDRYGGLKARNFPSHPRMAHGSFVGEIINVSKSG